MPVKILIIKPSSLGDIVHTLPAVAAIRDAQANAEITWVINSEWATLLRGNPDVDHLHIFPRSEFRGFGAPVQLLPWIRETLNIQLDPKDFFQPSYPTTIPESYLSPEFMSAIGDRLSALGGRASKKMQYTAVRSIRLRALASRVA